MKNYRTPRTLADCEFTSSYPEKRLSPPTKIHASTWWIIVCGIAGLIIVWYTK